MTCNVISVPYAPPIGIDLPWMHWRVLVVPRLQTAPVSFAHIVDLLLTKCRLLFAMSQLFNDLFSQHFQVHGIIRRSSSFNTGRIDHIYKDRHTTGVKVRVLHRWLDGGAINMLWFAMILLAIAICNYVFIAMK